jgi:hypothetical protein
LCFAKAATGLYRAPAFVFAATQMALVLSPFDSDNIRIKSTITGDVSVRTPPTVENRVC